MTPWTTVGNHHPEKLNPSTDTNIFHDSGKSPEAVFYNEAGQELERLDISGMKRAELRELMEVKGIKKKAEEEPAAHDEI